MNAGHPERPRERNQMTGVSPDSLDAEYEALLSDFCGRCGLIVHVEAIVWCDGEWRPLVRCPQDHLEVQL